jgi:hypothetical protein
LTAGGRSEAIENDYRIIEKSPIQCAEKIKPEIATPTSEPN